MKVRTRFFVAALSLFVFAAAALPCTAFFIHTGEEAVVGKSYDWSNCVGLVVVNKRGFEKTASVSDDNPARWASTYGSATFNQYGREFPLGGVNEAGLVVEVLWLDETIYPSPDERPALSCLSWVQYVLDTCATAAEAVATLENVRVVDETARVHYFIADAAGGCTVVEFLDGDAVVEFLDGDADMPARALANNTYYDSLSFLRLYEEEGTPEDIAGDGSRERFTRAALRANGYNLDFMDSATAVDYAADILDGVAMPDHSQWRIVYDLAGRRAYFRTRENMDTRWLELNAFDYSPGTPVKVFDMNAPGGGDVTEKFVGYTYEINRSLVDASFDGTPFLREIPEEARESMARYPETGTKVAEE